MEGFREKEEKEVFCNYVFNSKIMKNMNIQANTILIFRILLLLVIFTLEQNKANKHNNNKQFFQ